VEKGGARGGLAVGLINCFVLIAGSALRFRRDIGRPNKPPVSLIRPLSDTKTGWTVFGYWQRPSVRHSMFCERADLFPNLPRVAAENFQPLFIETGVP
jgi:hypothetical protein